MSEIRPLCPFCSKPWGDAAVELFDLSYDNYESTGPCCFEATISITCDGCDREMYRKEGVPLG